MLRVRILLSIGYLTGQVNLNQGTVGNPDLGFIGPSRVHLLYCAEILNQFVLARPFLGQSSADLADLIHLFNVQ